MPTQSPKPPGLSDPETGATLSPLRDQRVSGYWSETDKAFALAVYAETNSSMEASRRSGIPQTTIHQWVQSEWGDALVVKLRIALRERVAWKYQEIIDKALNNIMVSLERGDPVIYNGHVMGYAPVKAADLIKIAAIAQDRHALVTGQLEGSKKVDSQLNSLADKLMQRINNKLRTDDNVTPAPAIDASKLVG